MIRWEMTRVTPEIAAKWLAKNDVNRKLREHRCAFLARAIEDGKWLTTHQGLAFAKSGRLLDGQHRLRAIIMANKAVDVWVATNVPEEAFHVMDAGLPRKMHERIGGDPRRTMWATTLFRMVGPSRVPHEYEVELLLELFDDSFRAVEAIPGSLKASRLTRAPVMAAAVLKHASLDRDADAQLAMLDSFSKYLKGDVLGPKVITSLYRQMVEAPAATGGSTPATEAFARAWYALDPAHADVGKIQIKDVSTQLNEARSVFRKRTEGVFD